jgi:hypothetical protein
VGKAAETRGVFPGLSIGDRACAVRRGSAQPTVHKFIALLAMRQAASAVAVIECLLPRGEPGTAEGPISEPVVFFKGDIGVDVPKSGIIYSSTRR